jgi:threonine/homoserine/homoserine lactone efflux protein
MDAQLIAGVLALALLTVSPGADMALVARVAVARGHRAAVWTTLGICAGLPLHAAASALGLAAILAASATAFTVLKLLGAGYLMWLGFSAIKEAGGSEPTADASAATPTGRAHRTLASPTSGTNISSARAFLQGFLSNALNPKVALFYLAFLPQFMRPGDSVLGRSLLFAAIHAVQGIVWLTLYAYALDRLGALVRRSAVRRGLERTTGAVLIALGLRLAFERR